MPCFAWLKPVFTEPQFSSSEKLLAPVQGPGDAVWGLKEGNREEILRAAAERTWRSPREEQASSNEQSHLPINTNNQLHMSLIAQHIFHLG